MFGDLTYLKSLVTPEENCNISCRFMDLFVVNVDRSDVIVGTPECFNIQTRHKFANFCLFSLNSTYSIQNQVRYFEYVYNCVLSL